MFSEVVDLRQIADQMIETFDVMIERQNAYRDRRRRNCDAQIARRQPAG